MVNIWKLINLTQEKLIRALLIIAIIFLTGICIKLFNLNTKLTIERDKEKTERIAEVKEIANLRYYDKKECDSIRAIDLTKQIKYLQDARNKVEKTLKKTNKILNNK